MRMLAPQGHSTLSVLVPVARPLLSTCLVLNKCLLNEWIQKYYDGEFPGGPVVRTPKFLLQRAWVQSLVGKIRSCKLLSSPPKCIMIKNRSNQLIRIYFFYLLMMGLPWKSSGSPSNAGGERLIPGRRAKTPHTYRPRNQNIKQKQYCTKFSEDFLNGLH